MQQEQTIVDFLELCKPRIVTLVVITSALGYFAGWHGETDSVHLFALVVGVALSSGGACALNNYLERNHDLLMERTHQRALPSGRILPIQALLFGVGLVLIGVTTLVTCVNLLTGFLSLLTVFLYTCVYTPLKRVHWCNTIVGAIPGALPILGGWAAATNSLGVGAWTLFMIMFVWQHPHFYAIAWLYRDDYARGGFRMLSFGDERGDKTFSQMVLFSLLLIPVALSPVAVGLSGMIYFYVAIVMSLIMLMHSLFAARGRARMETRRVFLYSLLYLPTVLLIAVLDRVA